MMKDKQRKTKIHLFYHEDSILIYFLNFYLIEVFNMKSLRNIIK